MQVCPADLHRGRLGRRVQAGQPRCSANQAAEYRRTVEAVRSRTRVGNKPKPFRSYVLRSLLHCQCGTRMRGEAHLQRGTERRYYSCQKLGCRSRGAPAERLETDVLVAIAEAVVPESVIDAARKELRRRTQTPELASSGKQRARLTTRLDQLKKQHGWGDLTDDDYLAQRDETHAALAKLPDGDRIVAFDAHRARILALPEAIAAASPERREELCRIVVERVVVSDRQVAEIEWKPTAKPFLKRQRACPQGDSNP